MQGLKKKVRKWAVYKQLLTNIQTMVIVLPLVADLCSPSMQERHWQALMTVASHSFTQGMLVVRVIDYSMFMQVSPCTLILTLTVIYYSLSYPFTHSLTHTHSLTYSATPSSSIHSQTFTFTRTHTRRSPPPHSLSRTRTLLHPRPGLLSERCAGFAVTPLRASGG